MFLFGTASLRFPVTNLAWNHRQRLSWNQASKQVTSSIAITGINNIVLDLDVVEVDSDSESSQHGGDNAHPQFTDLVRISGRDLSLGHQHFEVKLVIRKAMDKVVERLLFENGFPSLAMRAIWNRRTLLSACSSIEQATGSHAQGRYQQLLLRIKTDAEYVKELSRLVSVYVSDKHMFKLVFKLDARLPIVRGNLKLIAATHVTKVYDLGHAGKDSVLDLQQDMKYIYPPSTNVRIMQTSFLLLTSFRVMGWLARSHIKTK
jgi:hypothetical protein